MKIQFYLTKDINIAVEPDAIGEEKYGSKIVATVSHQLTQRFGKGYQRANIFRMLKSIYLILRPETRPSGYITRIVFFSNSVNPRTTTFIWFSISSTR